MLVSEMKEVMFKQLVQFQLLEKLYLTKKVTVQIYKQADKVSKNEHLFALIKG
jgi:hypothetical protein